MQLNQKSIIRVFVATVLCLSQNLRADLTKPSTTPETQFAEIQSLRTELNKALHEETRARAAQLAPANKQVRDQARKLSEFSEFFLSRYPTNTNLAEVVRQNAYGLVLASMLDKNNAAILGSVADSIPSCLFKADLVKTLQISASQASDCQSAAELGFAEAAGDALHLGPESLNGLFVFLRKAGTVAGIKLAESILASSVTNNSLRLCAKAVSDRKTGIGRTISMKFTSVDGRQVDLSKLKGKVVLIDFWRTDCAPCMSALPELISLEEKYREQGLEFIGINTDTDKQALLRVVRENRITWPNYWDGKGLTNEFAITCGVAATPDYWLLDRDGLVQEMGATSDLEKKIQFLISQKP